MNTPYVAVFGGCNMDISGKSKTALLPHDSNPGDVSMTPGGVGRNIAANIALVGIHTKIVTAFGDDDKKTLILQNAPEKLSFESAFTFGDVGTGSYLVVLDDEGEMVVAVNDMKAVDKLGREEMESRRELAENASYTVVDANLKEEALQTIFSWDMKIVVDGVSAVKVGKFKPFLSKINVLKCSVLEARALSELGDGASISDCGRALLNKGSEHVLITAGSDGAYLYSQDQSLHFTTSPMAIKGATGAGDAFVGMLTAELVQEKSLEEAIVGAMAASRMVLKSDHSDLSVFDRRQWEKEKEEIQYDII